MFAAAVADLAAQAVDAAADVLDRGRHLRGDTAGILLGIAADKMFYEELRLRRLAAMGRAAGGRHRLAAALRQCADVWARAADISGVARTARRQKPIGPDGHLGMALLVTHADRRRDRARFRVRPALQGFSRLPR